jgi:hypothetical protein
MGSLDTTRGRIRTVMVKGVAPLEGTWREVPRENLRELLCEDVYGGLDPESLLIEDKEICLKLETLEVDGLSLTPWFLCAQVSPHVNDAPPLFPRPSTDTYAHRLRQKQY